MTSLLDIIEECEDNKEVLQDLHNRKYTREIISGTLDVDILSHVQMIEAMQSSLFLNYSIDGIWEEFLFRIGNNSELRAIYYTSDRRPGTYVQYSPSPRMPQFIIDALALKYGPPPYDPEHLNMTANLSMKRAAQIGNTTLFKRFYTSAHREDSIYNLSCFIYATLDIDWKSIPIYTINLWLEHAIEAQQPEVFHAILANTQTNTIPSHLALRIITKDAFLFIPQIPDMNDAQIHENLVTCMQNKAPNCFKALLTRASEQYMNHPDTSKRLYDAALYITTTRGLQMLRDAGIEPHSGQYKLFCHASHLPWLYAAGIKWQQIEYNHPPIITPNDISLFDECNFEWHLHSITDLTNTPHEAIILRLLDRKCQWDSSLYNTISRWYGATGSLLVKIHTYAADNKLPDRQLTPPILPTLRLQAGELNIVAKIFHHDTCATCKAQKKSPPQSQKKKDWTLCPKCAVVITCSPKCSAQHHCQSE